MARGKIRTTQVVLLDEAYKFIRKLRDLEFGRKVADLVKRPALLPLLSAIEKYLECLKSDHQLIEKARLRVIKKLRGYISRLQLVAKQNRPMPKSVRAQLQRAYGRFRNVLHAHGAIAESVCSGEWAQVVGQASQVWSPRG